MNPKIRPIAVAVVATAPLFAGCHHRPTISKSQAQDEVGHRLDESSVVAPGTVEPWSGETKLASTEPGQLSEVLVVEGQLVKTGELLARLEDSQQQHAVMIAEAELRQAVAALAGSASTTEDLVMADAELQAATARAAQTRRESERALALAASGALSSAEVERAVSSSQESEATRAAVEARFKAMKRGARSSERNLVRARWESATARLADTRASLARREVRATVDGAVLWSRYHAGEFYAPAQGPLLVLGDTHRLQVRLEVDDVDATLVASGAPCELRSDAGESLGRGSVVRVAAQYGTRSLSTERPTARTDARVREVFVEVEGSTSLAPGQRVWGRLARSALHASR
jgi:HlyD family secretion protein